MVVCLYACASFVCSFLSTFVAGTLKTKEPAKRAVGTLKKGNTVEMARNSEVGKHSNKSKQKKDST